MSNLQPEAFPNYLGLARSHMDNLQAAHEATLAQLGGGAFVGPVARRKLTLMASTPDRFIAAVASTLEENPALATLSPRSPAEMRGAVAATAALTEMADRYELLGRECRETVAVRRAQVAEDAMRAYNICKSANRVSDLREAIPQVKDMKAALGRSKAKKVTPPVEGPAVSQKGAI